MQVDCLPAEPQGKPKNIGMGSLSLLQQIFPTQEENQGLLHCRQILYQLSYKGSPLCSLHIFKSPQNSAKLRNPGFLLLKNEPAVKATVNTNNSVAQQQIQRCQEVGFPGGSESKESACQAGDLGLIPGLGRSPGEGNGNPHQYSCLENPHGQRNLVGYNHGVTKSQTQLSD